MGRSLMTEDAFRVKPDAVSDLERAIVGWRGLNKIITFKFVFWAIFAHFNCFDLICPS